MKLVDKLNESFDRLSPIFDYVTKDMYDWKDPIRSYIPMDIWSKMKLDERVVSEAVNFFTAVPATVTYDGYVGDEGYWVESKGYYGGPA